MRGLSAVAASGGHSSSRCAGLSLSRPLLLRSTSSRRAGSVVVAHGPSCSAACGILPDQGSNPCPPHRQADSQPLRHQGSPCPFLNRKIDQLRGKEVFKASTEEKNKNQKICRQCSCWELMKVPQKKLDPKLEAMKAVFTSV